MTVATDPAEALARTLAVIGGKWTVEIVSALLGGPRRYGHIKATLGGISPRILSDRLKELEQQGFVTRTLYPEIPPCVDYALTDAGHTLAPIIAAMVAWGEARGTNLTGIGSTAATPDSSPGAMLPTAPE